MFFTIGRRRWATITAPRGGALLGRAARGSTLRKMACPLARGSVTWYRAQGHRRAHREGQLGRCPFQSGERNGRQENTRPCVEHAVFTSVFAALGTVFVLGAGAPKPRR